MISLSVEYATDSDGFISEKWDYSGEFYDWLNNSRCTVYVVRRYEVATKSKEPLYHVLLSDKGATNIGYTFLNLAGTIDFKICKEEVDMLTEQEIKAIDERYWAFAVKVEGE